MKHLHRMTRLPSPPIMVLLALGCLTVANAQAAGKPLAGESFSDSYTLSTSNQALFGANNSWSYDSGFVGASWGTYAGGNAVTGGINAITGNAHELLVPAIPGIPGTPGTPPTKGVCVFGVCGPDIPGIPGTPGTPGTPAVYGDTRTGAAITSSMSGRVGTEVSASASGGSIAVSLQATTHLQIGALVLNSPRKGLGEIQFPSYSSFIVSATNDIGSNSSLTVTAPQFKASVDGVLNMHNSFAASGCAVGAGCSSSSFSANIDPGRFAIVSVDTSKNAPISVFGQSSQLLYGKSYDLRVTGAECDGACKNAGGVIYATIEADKPTGWTGTGTALAAPNSQTALKLSADLTGIAQAAANIPLDALSPSYSFGGVGKVSGTLVNAKATSGLSVDNSLNFTPHLMVTLTFSEDVVWFEQISCSNNNTDAACAQISNGRRVSEWFKPHNLGKTSVVDTTQNKQLGWAGAVGTLISRSYSMSNSVNNLSIATSLGIDPVIPVKAGCFDIKLVSGLGETGVTCAYDHTFQTVGVQELKAYSSNIDIGGFNSATFTTAVPEPQSWAMFIAGLTLLPWLARRRR